MNLQEILGCMGVELEILERMPNPIKDFPLLLIADNGKEFKVINIIMEFTSTPKICFAIEELL